jgi:hypothetical protein
MPLFVRVFVWLLQARVCGSVILGVFHYESSNVLYTG